MVPTSTSFYAPNFLWRAYYVPGIVRDPGIGQRAEQVKTPPFVDFTSSGTLPHSFTISRSLFQLSLLVNTRLGVKFSKYLLSVYSVPGTVLSILYALSHWHLYQFPHNHMKEALLLFSCYKGEAEGADQRAGCWPVLYCCRGWVLTPGPIPILAAPAASLVPGMVLGPLFSLSCLTEMPHRRSPVTHCRGPRAW